MKNFFCLFLLFFSFLAFAAQAQNLAPIESSVLTGFSPDGSKFLYADALEGELFIYDFGFKTARKIVTLQSGDAREQTVRIFSPLWVPEKEQILFISVDTAMAAASSGQVWSVKTDGSEFHALTKISLKPGFVPLYTPNFLSLLPDGRLLFFDYDDKAKSQILETVDAKGESRSSFIWQKGILHYQWSPNRSYLAYLAESSSTGATQEESPVKSSGNVNLWLTRADGGMLKRLSSSVSFSKDFRFPPVAWSDDSAALAFFSEQIDEKGNAYQELHVQHPQSGLDRVISKTWGVPVSSLSWSADGKRLSYLESDVDSSKTQLVTIELKIKKGLLVDVQDLTRVDLADHSILLGWDPSDKKTLYLLSPRKGKQGYSLYRQRWNKPDQEELLQNLPEKLFYYFDHHRHRIIFCGEEGGCQLVSTPSGKSEWILPNIHSTLRAGDFQLQMGEYAQAEKIYASIDAKGLERNHFLSLETRRYVALLLGGQKEKAKAKWDDLLTLIEKGETQPADYARVAKAFERVHEHGQALDMYKKTMDEYAASSEAKEALLQSGFIYREIKEFDFAKNCFANFARLYPKDKRATDALVELGETFLAKEEPGKAIKVFRKVAGVAKDEEQRTRAFLGKAKSLEKMNLFADAAKTYRLVLDGKDGKKKIDRKYFEEASRALSRLEAEGS